MLTSAFLITFGLALWCLTARPAKTTIYTILTMIAGCGIFVWGVIRLAITYIY